MKEAMKLIRQDLKDLKKRRYRIEKTGKPELGMDLKTVNERIIEIEMLLK